MKTKELHANVTLDMRGLTCPAPLLGAFFTGLQKRIRNRPVLLIHLKDKLL